MPAPVTSVRRSAAALRRLTAHDLDVGVEAALRRQVTNRPDEAPLRDDDPRYVAVLDLLEYYGGVIFTGPPGTSKSWYASAIARRLAGGDTARIRLVQFHPSYQYEDFMQGFVPRTYDDGRFESFSMEDKHFVRMCREAVRRPDDTFVLVIDELSRGEPGRIFGEALTYIEKSRRGVRFTLSSGDELAVPPNLVILATMNPLDRGVDEVDAAFERRFAKIAMEPDRDLLLDRLMENGVGPYLQRRIVNFFNKANGFARSNPQGAIGHTYFFDVADERTLQRVWDSQLSFLIERAYRLDPETHRDLDASFERLLDPPPESDDSDGSNDEP